MRRIPPGSYLVEQVSPAPLRFQITTQGQGFVEPRLLSPTLSRWVASQMLFPAICNEMPKLPAYMDVTWDEGGCPRATWKEF